MFCEQLGATGRCFSETAYTFAMNGILQDQGYWVYVLGRHMIGFRGLPLRCEFWKRRVGLQRQAMGPEGT